MAATFNPGRWPSNIQVTRKVNEKTNEFGDGYCQNILDGINAIRDELNCTWNGLTHTEFAPYNTFFKTNAGKTFNWNPFKETTPRLWRVSEWSPSYIDGRVNLTVKMQEAFA